MDQRNRRNVSVRRHLDLVVVYILLHLAQTVAQPVYITGKLK
jgi:hypothetical protein